MAGIPTKANDIADVFRTVFDPPTDGETFWREQFTQANNDRIVSDAALERLGSLLMTERKKRRNLKDNMRKLQAAYNELLRVYRQDKIALDELLEKTEVISR